MTIATVFLAALLLVVSLVPECSCLAAQSYSKSTWQKYHSNWAASAGYFSDCTTTRGTL